MLSEFDCANENEVIKVAKLIKNIFGNLIIVYQFEGNCLYAFPLTIPLYAVGILEFRPPGRYRLE